MIYNFFRGENATSINIKAIRTLQASSRSSQPVIAIRRNSYAVKCFIIIIIVKTSKALKSRGTQAQRCTEPESKLIIKKRCRASRHQTANPPMVPGGNAIMKICLEIFTE